MGGTHSLIQFGHRRHPGGDDHRPTRYRNAANQRQVRVLKKGDFETRHRQPFEKVTAQPAPDEHRTPDQFY